MFIAAYDVESPESLLIELPERRAQDILNEFGNDYESMASSLQVMNKRLVLLNPVSINYFYNQFKLLSFFIEIRKSKEDGNSPYRVRQTTNAIWSTWRHAGRRNGRWAANADARIICWWTIGNRLTIRTIICRARRTTDSAVKWGGWITNSKWSKLNQLLV